VLRRFPLSMRTLQADDIVESRVGFVIRKRTGNAPLRNAMRRVLRELFNKHSEAFTRPTWVVFDVAEKASDLTRTAFREKADEMLASLCRGEA
jgi:ribonuclease P protein component